MRLTNDQCRRWLNRHYSTTFRAGYGIDPDGILSGTVEQQGAQPILDTRLGWRVRKDLVSVNDQLVVRTAPIRPHSLRAIGRSILANPHSWHVTGSVLTAIGLLFSPPVSWLYPVMMYGMLYMTLYILQTSLVEQFEPRTIERLYVPAADELRSILKEQPREVRQALSGEV